MESTSSTGRRRVEMAHPLPLDQGRAQAALARCPESVVGSRAETTWPGMTAELGPNQWLQREVRVGFAPIQEDDDGRQILPVWWEAAQHPQLFPTFDGGLHVRAEGTETTLWLAGSYQPPMGRVGQFADGFLGHRLVVASLRTFLGGAATRLLEVAEVLGPSALEGHHGDVSE